MPSQWATFMDGLSALVEPKPAPTEKSHPSRTSAPEPESIAIPAGVLATQAAPLNPPPRRRSGWPRPGPGRPRKQPSVGRFEERLAQVRAAHASPPEPEPQAVSRVDAWLTRTVPDGPGRRREPTLLEAYLARHPDAPAEMWAAAAAQLETRVSKSPPRPQAEPTEYRGRGRPRMTDQRRRPLPRECECGNPSLKQSGKDFRCQRCRDMEAAQFHVGESDTEFMRKAYDPRWRAVGYVDKNNYRASPASIPNVSPENFASPGVRHLIRNLGRLHASEIRQTPYSSAPPWKQAKRTL